MNRSRLFFCALVFCVTAGAGVLVNPYRFAAGGTTPALIAHAKVVGTQNGPVTTSAINTTGATLIVIGSPRTSAQVAPAITDSQGNTWTLAEESTTATIVSVRLYYCFNPTTDASHTFTSGSGTDIYSPLIVQAWSGMGSGTLDSDVSAGSDSTGTTFQAGSVTPSQVNTLVIALHGGYTSGYTSIDSGFTISDSQVTVDTQSWSVAMAWKLPGSTSAQNPTWTFASNERAAAINAVFTY